MSKKPTRIFKLGLFLLAMLGSQFDLLAQPGDPETDPDVPISGIEILIGLGGLFGAKKIYDLRKKK
ncbi:MAG: hypothetical protein ACOYXT_26915 [Bacteroidota bacterium]